MIICPVYLLDTNVFVTAAETYYAFDIAPGFWNALVEQAKAGHVLSIDRVREELERQEDTLSDWARTTFNQWFASTNQADVVEVYRGIIEWVIRQEQFRDYAKVQFARGADGWLIAYAKAKRCIVVTHEQFSSDAQKKVPIPNVCRQFGVPYVDTFIMLRNCGIRLC